MNTKKLFIILLLVCVAVLNSCEKDKTIDISTKKVTEISQATALSGGYIKGSDASSYRVGIVWDINPQPTLENMLGRTDDVVSKGEFLSTANRLNPNTKYYIRAYATTQISEFSEEQWTVVYGDQLEFTTNGMEQGNGVVDIDNNEYTSVIIGKQEWMVENLRTTKLNDGSSIPNLTGDEQWSATRYPAFCWYDNDKTKYGDAYGALYNFYAVETGNLCPTGWHVATHAEWLTLLEYAGEEYGGGRLKSTRVVPDSHPRWETPNGYATNVFGFSAFPTGNRLGNGEYSMLGFFGYWWSSTVVNDWSAYAGALDNIADGYIHGNFDKNCGLAVRCIKDID